MWWLLGTLGAVVVVAGVLVLGNKRQQRRATGRLARRVKKGPPPPPKRPPSAFVEAPDPQILQACTARGCYESKSPKKGCKCPCGGKLHGMGRPGPKKKVACTPVATPRPVSTSPASGPRGALTTATRIETTLRAHAQASPRCGGGTITRRTFGDGRVTYTCNTCKTVLAS